MGKKVVISGLVNLGVAKQSVVVGGVVVVQGVDEIDHQLDGDRVPDDKLDCDCPCLPSQSVRVLSSSWDFNLSAYLETVHLASLEKEI